MTTTRRYLLERVPPPSWISLYDVSVADELLGAQAEWGYAIPWTFQALAAPRARVPMPTAPAPGDDPSPGALGYWSALLHLLVYGFGWSRPGRGLLWWHANNRPTNDKKFALIDQVWRADGQLDWFHAWLLTFDDHEFLPFPGTGDLKLDVGWLNRVAAEAASSSTPAPIGAGYDPLHLASHVDGPRLEPRHEPVSVRVDERRRRATVVLSSMIGWYTWLTCTDEGLIQDDGIDGGYTIDVVVTALGWLGTYQRSTKTGLWYSGRHTHHLAGN